jgi:hypothetical protein
MSHSSRITRSALLYLIRSLCSADQNMLRSSSCLFVYSLCYHAKSLSISRLAIDASPLQIVRSQQSSDWPKEAIIALYSLVLALFSILIKNFWPSSWSGCRRRWLSPEECERMCGSCLMYSFSWILTDPVNDSVRLAELDSIFPTGEGSSTTMGNSLWQLQEAASISQEVNGTMRVKRASTL